MKTKVGIYKVKTSAGIRWNVRWFGRYDLATGKPKRYSKTFALRKDAQHFQKVKSLEFDGGAARDVSVETLKEYAEQWLKYQTINVPYRPGTVTLYELTFKRLYNHFGPDISMAAIDRRAAKEFLAGLKPIGNGKPLSNWSRHRVLRQCKSLFSEAVKDKVII